MVGFRRQRCGVTALLLTHYLPDDAVERFVRIRRLVEEFVVFVDTDNAPDATIQRARAFATQVFEISTGGIAETRDEMISACPTEWILKLDSDEDLCPEWNDGRWRDLLALPEVTHFALPRRWLLPQGGFIAQTPWWPDPQIRLFKRDEARSPMMTHQPLIVRGRAAFCRYLALDHYALFQSRAEREAKVRRYEALVGAGALAYFYLAEDYSPASQPLPSAPSGSSNQVFEMNPLGASDCKSISFTIDGLPRTMQCDQLHWLEVTIHNGSEREVSCGLPSPINIAYHWCDSDSGGIVVFDGVRSHLFPPVAPNSSCIYHAMIIAPPANGSYLLQITLVQEGVRWFDEAGPHRCVVERIVDVLG